MVASGEWFAAVRIVRAGREKVIRRNRMID